MSIAQNPPPPLGPDWKPWGERLIDYLKRVRSKLPFFETGDSATEDGVMLWDTTGYPVISKGGEYRQIVLADGFGTFVSNTDQTTTANTATAISWDSMPLGDGVSMGTPSSRIVFEEAGYYLLPSRYRLRLHHLARRRCTSGPDSTVQMCPTPRSRCPCT
jgi:hypothetical protein